MTDEMRNIAGETIGEFPVWWEGAGWYEVEWPDGYDEASWASEPTEVDAADDDVTVTFCGDGSLPEPVCRVSDACMDLLDPQALADYREWLREVEG